MKKKTAIDQILTRWMAEYGITFLRISIGILYIWFGGLKFFPGLSPAEDLAISTIDMLTFGLMPSNMALFFLATFEVIIGLLMATGTFLRFTILLLMGQMVGTMSPIILFPEVIFSNFPLVLTIEGQYIFKNFVIISAALVVGATVRGGRLISEPDPESDPVQ
tara:strand:+ start:12297 stop:12785 length:489 start_codon:yes stop_codon:yes gene_type:complete